MTIPLTWIRTSQEPADEYLTEYTWDHHNRLVQVTHYDEEGGTADLVVEYAYDFGNRWVRKIVDPGGQDEEKTIFVYDGNQIALQFDGTGTGDLGAEDLSHRYLWGPAVDQILADEQVHWDAGEEEYVTDELLWPLGDHLGTLRDVIDNAGTVRIHRVYDAFGNITSEQLRNAANEVVSPGQPGALLELLAFTARPLDAATGLQNNLHRWYDASTGRWLSEDPIGFTASDSNPYRYVGNSPTIQLDPEGLEKAKKKGKPFPSSRWFFKGIWITRVAPAGTQAYDYVREFDAWYWREMSQAYTVPKCCSKPPRTKNFIVYRTMPQMGRISIGITDSSTDNMLKARRVYANVPTPSWWPPFLPVSLTFGHVPHEDDEAALKRLIRGNPRPDPEVNTEFPEELPCEEGKLPGHFPDWRPD